MKCENCGKELPTHKSVCPYCGNSIIENRTEENFNQKSFYIKIIVSVLIIVFILAMGIAGIYIKNQKKPIKTATMSENTSTSSTTTTTTEEEVTTEEVTEANPFDELYKYKPGQYKVGSDLPAGEYIIFAYDDGGYFCVSSDPNSEDIVFNDNFASNSIIEVRDEEYLLLDDCFAVSSDEFRENLSIKPDGSGIMLLVGKDIDAGEYKLETDDSTEGYYCIYDSARQDNIIANDNFSNSSYISISDGQYLLLSYCHIVD